MVIMIRASQAEDVILMRAGQAEDVILMRASQAEDVILMRALRRLRSSGQAPRAEDLLVSHAVRTDPWKMRDTKSRSSGRCAAIRMTQ